MKLPVLTLCGALLLTVLAGLSPVLAAEDEPSAAIVSAAVEQKTISDTLVSYGVLIADPDQLIKLTLPAAGMISEVWVRAGQRVNQGDKLLDLQTAPEVRNEFVQAQSALVFATAERDRLGQLVQEQLATRSELSSAEKNLADAQATLAALTLRGANHEVDTQVAPVAGIVSDMLVAKGDRISADTVVLHLTAETGMIVSLGIDPEDLDKLTVGMPVTIQPVFGATSESAATVIQIHAMINPASNLVELLAEIPAADLQHFVLGSRLTGTFHFAPHTAFVVPRSAVLTADGEAFVYTIANGTATRVVVETGIEAGEELEVRGDLQPGQRVAVIGNYVLEDGMAVRENP